MKTLKLTAFEADALSEKKMSKMFGGTACGCGCKYKDQGGSSTDDNGSANAKGGGKYSPNVPLEDMTIVVVP